MKQKMLLPAFFILLGFGFSTSLAYFESPQDVIDDLQDAVERAERDGNYRCCIEPPCTMCYLGHWKFEKGTCFCDDAISAGKSEDVCPECKKGIEKGLCKSHEHDDEKDGAEEGEQEEGTVTGSSSGTTLLSSPAELLLWNGNTA